MIQTIFQYTGDGTTTHFTGPYCDFNVSALEVTVDNLTVEFSYDQQTQQVTITPAPGGGKAVEIKRVTALDDRLVTFTNATLLDAETQNLDSKQLFYALQERLYVSEESLQYGGATGVNWNARNKLIKLLADPVDNLDAVNKQFLVSYAQAYFGTVLSTAEGYKDQAYLYRNAAEGFANDAEASANDAAAAATTAAATATAAVQAELDDEVAAAAASAVAADASADAAAASALAADASADAAAASAVAADGSADAAAASAAAAAATVGAADTLDGFHASQSPYDNHIPVRQNSTLAPIADLYMTPFGASRTLYTYATYMGITAPSTIHLCRNMYYDGTNWRYLTDGQATLFNVANQTIEMYIAGWGNAGNLVSLSYVGCVPFVAAVPADATKVLRGDATWTQVAEAMMALSDVTTLDVSTAKHGFCPKAPNDTLKFLRGDGTWAAPTVANADTLDNLHAGQIVNVVHASTSSLRSTTNILPQDDTIPQISEGAQALSASITPQNANNRLIIRAILQVDGATSYHIVGALFQNSTANALKAAATYSPSGDHLQPLILEHSMLAGATSSQTFSVRFGPGDSGTAYVNGVSTRLFGGVSASSLTIIEVTE